MKKSLWALAAVVLLAGGGLLFVSQKGAVGVLDLLAHGGSDEAWLAARSIDFLEDLQFKDFDSASNYHLKEAQDARDIPALIQKAFGIRHEILDIKNYKVLEVDLDRSGKRSRVRMLINFHVLGEGSIRDDPGSQRQIELLLYWFKNPAGQWTMELESSLR